MYGNPHLSDTTRLFSTKKQRFPQISFRERHGGIAQLGERLTGSQEVSGSIPLISTIGKPGKLVLMKVKTSFFLFLLFGRLTYLRLPVLCFPLTGVPSGTPVFYVQISGDYNYVAINNCAVKKSIYAGMSLHKRRLLAPHQCQGVLCGLIFDLRRPPIN